MSRTGPRREKAEQRAVRAKHSRHLRGEFVGGRAIEVVHHVPAEDAVERGIGLRKSLLEELGQRLQLAFPRVAFDIGEDVLDENLAPELLAEEIDVARRRPARDRAGPATRGWSAT